MPMDDLGCVILHEVQQLMWLSCNMVKLSSHLT